MVECNNTCMCSVSTRTTVEPPITVRFLFLVTSSPLYTDTLPLNEEIGYKRAGPGIKFASFKKWR